MFTVHTYRRIDSHLKYVINVVNMDKHNALQHPVKVLEAKHLDEAVKLIEECKEKYVTKENMALFVEVITYVHTVPVRVEAFWVDYD